MQKIRIWERGFRICAKCKRRFSVKSADIRVPVRAFEIYNLKRDGDFVKPSLVFARQFLIIAQIMP